MQRKLVAVLISIVMAPAVAAESVINAAPEMQTPPIETAQAGSPLNPVNSADSQSLAPTGDPEDKLHYLAVTPHDGLDMPAAADMDGIALGQGAKALASTPSGSAGVAIGNGATSQGFSALAMGEQAEAKNGGIALGLQAAAGVNTDAANNSAVAVGNFTSATTNGTALGMSATAGDSAYAGGYFAKAQGDSSVAMGAQAESQAVNSVAIGAGAIARHENALALGAESETNQANSVSIGSDGNDRKLVHVAGGALNATSNEAVNGAQLFETNTRLNGIDGRVGVLEQGISGVKNSAQYDNDAHDKMTLSAADGGKTTLTGLREASLEQGSADAVTGSQLWETNQKVAGNSHKISAIENKMSNTGEGIVQRDSKTKQITIGKNDDGKVINVAGSEGDRVISGVADGVGRTDAANFGQLNNYFDRANQNSQRLATQSYERSKNYTDHKVKKLRDEVNRKNRKQDAGISSAVAIGSIPQNWQYENNFGMGVGGYNGQGSIAAKYGHKIRENVALSFSAGLDTTGEAAYGVGVGVGW